MIHSPPQLVWIAHGSPAVDGCVEAEGRCYVCGGNIARGVPVKKWMSASFSDHTRVACPSSPTICEACVHVMSRVAPVLGRPAGKCSVCEGTLKVTKIPKAGKGSRSKKGDDCPKCEGSGMNPGGSNFRNVCHLWEEGWEGVHAPGYANASKGEKPVIRAFLERDHVGPWFAAIGDTGQLHVLPYAELNGPGRSGVVLFERQTVVVPEDVSLVETMCELLTEGATKEEIATGDYFVRTMREETSRELARAFEATHGHLRFSGWFSLAIWLAQRNEEEFQRRDAVRKEASDARRKGKKAARRLDGGDGAHAPIGVPDGARRETAAGLLDPVSKPNDRRVANDGDGQRVDRHDAGDARDRQPQQLTIPGLG